MALLQHHRSAWLGGPGSSGGTTSAAKPTLILTNSPASGDLAPCLRLWESGVLGDVLCADGGANRLFDALRSTDEERRASFVPQFIVGDLDSLRAEVSTYYQALGTSLVQDPNQDNNDLDKCLDQVLLRRRRGHSGDSSPPAEILVYGAFGGRFDQQMAAFSSLFRVANAHANSGGADGTVLPPKVVLLGEGNLAFLLQPGFKHTISLQASGGKEGPGCALIPIGCKADAVTTKGLKWDLNAQPLEFGHLISTSNRAVADTVEVESSHPLVWVVDVVL